jgi:CRP/FNR family transcriptional regulator, cyclic AMP receptor protein
MRVRAAHNRQTQQPRTGPPSRSFVPVVPDDLGPSTRRPDVPLVLRSLPETDVERMLRAGRLNAYPRREMVVREGDVADSFHILLEGRAAVQVTTSSGDNAIVNILGPDSHFGEVSLLGRDDPRRTASVVALEPVRTLSIPADVFRGLCDRNPRLERLVTGLLARRVEELSAQLVEALHENLEERVVRRLESLARTYAGSSGPITIALTQDQLSQLVGGARPTVNQILGKLADEGLLRCSRGRVTVLQPDCLSRRAGVERIMPERAARPPRRDRDRRATSR